MLITRIVQTCTLRRATTTTYLYRHFANTNSYNSDPFGDAEAAREESMEQEANNGNKTVKLDQHKYEDYKGQEYYKTMQTEQAIQGMQTEIRHLYANNEYEQALMMAAELVERCEVHFGKSHPVTASSYNNMAVMHKVLGQFEESREKYHQALRVYDEIVGKKHLSYAAALHNLGILEKDQARIDTERNAMDRMALLESAIEQLNSALEIRKESLGEAHPDTISSRTNLGSAIAAQVLQGGGSKGNLPKQSAFTKRRWKVAETHLRTALRHSMENKSEEEDAIEMDSSLEGLPKIRTLSAARMAQNLAVFLKSRAEQLASSKTKSAEVDIGEMLAESRSLYEAALTVRMGLLGAEHPDTISSKFSLAELVAFLGDEEDANKMRQEIVDLLGQADGEEEAKRK
mmetsp:Transcript_12715/g.19170  ORF Transcript_12715/g.19170 Transcript_12715/m.19170 type:complete len:402 (+) Transcript_12715:1-1206(+)